MGFIGDIKKNKMFVFFSIYPHRVTAGTQEVALKKGISTLFKKDPFHMKGLVHLLGYPREVKHPFTWEKEILVSLFSLILTYFPPIFTFHNICLIISHCCQVEEHKFLYVMLTGK